jgi:hypothetical protein
MLLQAQLTVLAGLPGLQTHNWHVYQARCSNKTFATV